MPVLHTSNTFDGRLTLTNVRLISRVSPLHIDPLTGDGEEQNSDALNTATSIEKGFTVNRSGFTSKRNASSRDRWHQRLIGRDRAGKTDG